MTLEKIESEIAYAEELKARVKSDAEEESVREYRQDLYARVDRINDRLGELYQMRNRLRSESRVVID